MNCMKCNTPVMAGANACGTCGQVMAVSGGQPPQAPPQAPMNQYQQMPMQRVEKDQKGLAIASLVLGIVGMVAWIIPLFGFPAAMTGLVLGIMGQKSSAKTMAIIGIALSGLALVATIVNAAWGAYLGATGQHPLV